MSKDLKPGKKLGQTGSGKGRIVLWVVILLALAGGSFAAYRYSTAKPVEVPTVSVRQGEFTITITSRGEIRSTRSVTLAAPQVPNPTITTLAESGKPVKAGEIVVEFDTAQYENYYLNFVTNARTVDSEIVQTKASHKITDEEDAMSLMTSEYDVQRAGLEASKAEILSEIEGAKNRINVGLSEGVLGQVKTSVKAHDVSQQADLERLDTRKSKTLRDMGRVKDYLGKMTIRAPQDGILNILPNFRAQGNWGQTPPAFKEGDRAWTGAAIAEIPDLSEMRIEMKVEEVDRGKIQLGQKVRVKIDAIQDKEFEATLDWISPIASLNFRGFGSANEKTFPARATLKSVDPRLRPGMSASGIVLIESRPDSLLIPNKASFLQGGKPHVWIQRGAGFQSREIEVGKRNDNDIIVLKGLKTGDRVALEDPAEVAKRSKKL
ncbi:efflux RND transporter periplasmic adaptor subunit [uncultured Paludibaculum sp.]|uniref:efflux RND transporter periplasmic adaptor subunit n=1 Tax=uncultured Paludibaculum sp. TaxID=1765020 RepID=UPI002AAAD3A7|nr:efflux RND transporter periplasmic adaptor subunit [uncultured Paludibaculum sp.]